MPCSTSSRPCHLTGLPLLSAKRPLDHAVLGSALATFTFNANTPTTTAHSIRVVTIDGQPWFVAVDVCRALNVYMQSNGKQANVTVACRMLDAGEHGLYRIQTPAPTCPTMVAHMRCVSESGLYKLIMRSDKAEAKEFQNWVTKEVLPSIRSGALEEYTPASQPHETPIASY